MQLIKKPDGCVELILLTIIVIWGINTPVMKVGLTEVPPLIYNALRLGVAAALCCAAMVLSGKYRPIVRQDIKMFAHISIAGYFGNQVLVVFGIPCTTAGNAALVLATLPVEMALINRMLKIEPITRSMAIGIIVGLLGVLLVVLGSDKELSLQGSHLIGALLLLGAQSCYSYYSVLSNQFVRSYSIYQIMACVMTANALLFGLLALPALVSFELTAISAAAWGSILYSATFAMSLANLVWIWAIGILGSAKAALYQYLCPIFSIIFAWFFLDEAFGPIQCVGTLITFVGLYITKNYRAPSCKTH